jgi:hypothetical protein
MATWMTSHASSRTCQNLPRHRHAPGACARSYFTTPHFDGYPAILVRRAMIRVSELEELGTEA